METGKETSWVGTPQEFIGEAIFVPRKSSASSSSSLAEDDGYLMSYMNDTKDDTAYLVIFDARDVTKGPISKVLLPVVVPFALHGHFANGLTFDFDVISRRFKVVNSFDFFKSEITHSLFRLPKL